MSGRVVAKGVTGATWATPLFMPRQFITRHMHRSIADKGCGEVRVGQQWPRLALFIASKLSNPAMDVPEICTSSTKCL